MKVLSMMVEKESGEPSRNVFGSLWKVVRSYGSAEYEPFFLFFSAYERG
jgi:hypothetical protein